VAATIRATEQATGYLAEPHTACGLHAAAAALDERLGARIVLATAHPAKFPDAMAMITGSRPPLPPRLQSLLQAPERIAALPNDLAAVEGHISAQARVTAGAGA
jgi:threonine synthase